MTSKLLPTPTEISLVRLPNTFCIPPAFWILTILNKDERKDCVRMEKKKKSEKLTSVCLLLWRQTLKWCFCLSCTRACFSKQIMLLETGQCSSTGLLRDVTIRNMIPGWWESSNLGPIFKIYNHKQTRRFISDEQCLQARTSLQLWSALL